MSADTVATASERFANDGGVKYIANKAIAECMDRLLEHLTPQQVSKPTVKDQEMFH